MSEPRKSRLSGRGWFTKYLPPWSAGLANSLASGTSTLGKHIREGVVVRPVEERVMTNGKRCVLKLHGEEFLLRNKLG